MEKVRLRIFKKVTLFIFTVCLLGGCASSGKLGNGDWQIYDKGYDEMKNVLQRAIYGGGLQIINQEETENGTLLTLKVEERTSRVEIEEATVYLRKQEESKSAVKVENPDYHYTVPDFKRKDYKRRIFHRIEVVLK